MSDFNHTVNMRKAHREAWYGPSSNPFRRTRTNQTFRGTSDSIRDVEAGEGDYEAPTGTSSDSMPNSTRRIQDPRPFNDITESPTSPQDPISEKSTEKETRMTGAGRTENSSDQTAVESQSIETEEKGGFMGRFRGKKDKGVQRTQTDKSTKSKKSLKHKKFTFANQIKGTIFNSWINILIIAAPVGIALFYVPSIPPIAIFIINFIAIIPLAALLSYATEEIALRVGEVLGGLLNATFGNAVELIVSIIALVKGEVLIVKTSLIGSILSNLLLVMGMCFFFGGLRRSEQFFNQTVASTAASLLALAIASVIIPTAFDIFTDTTNVPIAALSRGVAIILLVVYGCYLLFQLKTHSEVFQQESQKVAMRPRKHHVAKGGAFRGLAVAGVGLSRPGRSNTVNEETDGSRHDIIVPTAYEQQQKAEDDEPDEPNLHIFVALGLLAGATVIIALCAEFMVDSIDAFTAEYNISREFVGLILLPIVGNAAEHATAVTVACKDKMDLAIGVAVGSSMQVALLVIPFSVILGWILNNDTMNLSFDGFQVAVLFVSVLLVNYLIADGKSHWLEGVLLQCLYIIIAVTAWYYPQVALNA